VSDIALTVKALRARRNAGQGRRAGFCLGGRLAYLARARGVDCAVGYYGGRHRPISRRADQGAPPAAFRPAPTRISARASVAKIRAAFAGREEVEIFVYPAPGTASTARAVVIRQAGRPDGPFPRHRPVPSCDGPRFDLSQLWDKHCEYEFGTRNVADTMGTMVAAPYVNHIPTMTGGVGYDQLARFYQNHFIPKTPEGHQADPISRTIGPTGWSTRCLFCFTHDIEIDWMLPGVEPTGKAVKIPLGRHHLLPRRQAVQRAHLLGPGVGAGADRPHRPQAAAGRRRRDRRQADQREPALQYH